MDTSSTLFSHLAQKFSVHPENLATEALLYLLNYSLNANDIFSRYFSFQDHYFNSVTRFSSQVSSDGETIPDLVGTDDRGDSIFVIENKFWAELTPNQPLGYFPLLPADKSSALFFVAPEKRLSTLHTELIRLLNASNKYADLETIYDIGDVIIDRVIDSQYMALVSWRRLLSDLESLLDPIRERSLISDLNQLQGLCEQMDYEGFIPLRPQETGNLEIPRRILDYRDLVDGTVQLLRERSEATTDGLSSAASAYYSGRYLDLRKRGEFQALLAVDFSLWRKFGISPIWLKFYYGEFGRAAEVEALLSKTNIHIQKIEESPRLIGTPILLTPSSDRQKVIHDASAQIQAINRILLS